MMTSQTLVLPTKLFHWSQWNDFTPNSYKFNWIEWMAHLDLGHFLATLQRSIPETCEMNRRRTPSFPAGMEFPFHEPFEGTPSSHELNLPPCSPFFYREEELLYTLFAFARQICFEVQILFMRTSTTMMGVNGLRNDCPNIYKRVQLGPRFSVAHNNFGPIFRRPVSLLYEPINPISTFNFIFF